MANFKTLTDREQYVVKANDLIRKTRYDLTAQQQKIILFAISKIKPGDTPNTKYTFDLKELADACGLKIREGSYYYKSLKDDLDRLARPSWVTTTTAQNKVAMSQVAWLANNADVLPGDGTVTIAFHEKIQPFLFELKAQYTQYALRNVLVFRGKYAIRIYEIMRSYTTQRAIDNDQAKEVILTLDELREQLELRDKYKSWLDFDRYVIKPSIDEINNSEDIHVEYYPMRGQGTKAIKKINFVITRPDYEQRQRGARIRRERLDNVSRGGGAKK